MVSPSGDRVEETPKHRLDQLPCPLIRARAQDDFSEPGDAVRMALQRGPVTRKALTRWQLNRKKSAADPACGKRQSK